MSNILVRLHDVSKDYTLGSVRVSALRSVTLEIATGEFVALAGPSGSGKTTLLNLIGCVDKPGRGSIYLRERDITTLPLHKLAAVRAGTLGFIFQTFNLLPVLTAFENIEYPLLFSGMGKEARRAKVWHWLETVGLADKARHKPDQLSGGQRQRVAIARAMVSEPALVLADEPTASLDSHTAGEILDLLQDLNRKTAVTVVFATHDPKVIERAARLLLMRDGQITQDHHALETERSYAAC